MTAPPVTPERRRRSAAKAGLLTHLADSIHHILQLQQPLWLEATVFASEATSFDDQAVIDIFHFKACALGSSGDHKKKFLPQESRVASLAVDAIKISMGLREWC